MDLGFWLLIIVLAFVIWRAQAAHKKTSSSSSASSPASSPGVGTNDALTSRSELDHELDAIERFVDLVKKATAPVVREEDTEAFRYFGLGDVDRDALALPQVTSIISDKWLAPPYGLELIVGSQLPAMVEMPPRDPSAPADGRYERLEKQLKTSRKRIEKASAFRERCQEGDASAVQRVIQTTLDHHYLPNQLRLPSAVDVDTQARIVLCTIEVPDFTRLALAVEARNYRWKPMSEAQRKKTYPLLLEALCIRAAYLVAKSDPAECFDTVAVNAHQRWFDPATGGQKEGVIASLQALKEELLQLQPETLDVRACFRHLKGITTPNVLSAAPIRPIFVMDKNDDRIVANKDVVSQLDGQTNLAAMPWDDFEHLVGQIFELVFAKGGVEVKVTRASRDRGVDAIMFDPDPIRGGKYVLQAKRYTRTVDVAAVRDLYGTILNEGANKGILVTTATYGPDAYEFAKDKPISLIDGPNLLVLLKQHGKSYRIDLEEARRLEAEGRDS